MDAVDREFGRLGLNAHSFSRRSGVDTSLCYKVMARKAQPTNAFILGLVKVGIDLHDVAKRDSIPGGGAA